MTRILRKEYTGILEYLLTETKSPLAGLAISEVTFLQMMSVEPLFAAYRAETSAEVADFSPVCANIFMGNRAQLFKADYRGQAIGFAIVSYTRNVLTDRDEAVLDLIYVAQDFRSKKVALNLLLHIKDAAARRGATKLSWRTEDDNYPIRKISDTIAENTMWNRYEVNLTGKECSAS